MRGRWPGRPFPLGPTVDGSGTNFSLFSEYAERVELCEDARQGRQVAELLARARHRRGMEMREPFSGQKNRLGVGTHRIDLEVGEKARKKVFSCSIASVTTRPEAGDGLIPSVDRDAIRT